MKILFVDDDQLYRELLTKALTKNGYTVTAALNGLDALDKTRNDHFELIIIDIFMPEKEGIEVIQEIRLIQPAVKIIAISSDGVAGHSSFLKIAHAVGADGSLHKPFTPAQLIEKINEVTKSGEKDARASKIN